MAAQYARLLPSARVLTGWRGLRRFWAGVGLTTTLGAGVLQMLGPPPQPIQRLASLPSRPSAAQRPASQTAEQKPAPPVTVPAGRMEPGAIAEPDPALLVQYGPQPDDLLPRIAADGRTPMAVYAAGYDHSIHLPRVGLIITGIGLSRAESIAAVTQLPGAITLAVSPYATAVEPILVAMRKARHEYLLSLPMDPAGFPVNDPDDRHALMSSLSPEENLSRLHWVMSRIKGYIGVTNILGPMQGEAFSTAPNQIEPVLQDVGTRGLLFIAGPPGPTPLRYVRGRAADMVVDDPPADASTLDQRLDKLASMARNAGSALGIVTLPRPVTLERVAAWANGLDGKGVVLVPASALALPPAGQQAQQ